jgi:peptidyl-prolyl cis-trans isomerase D
MLQALRSKVGSWVVKILFVLLILSFAAWGVGDIFTNQVSTEVATVGDRTITTTELDRAFRTEIDRMRQLFQTDVDLDGARQLGLLDGALEQLISRHLYAIEADELGLAIPDGLLLGRVRAEPAFRNALGQFDADVFRRVLAANALSERAYLDAVRADIRNALLLQSVTAGATAPRSLVAEVYRHQAQRRTVEAVFLPNEAVAMPPDPDEETIAKFHQERAVRFTAPEYRALTIARVAPEDLMDEIPVAEEDIVASYEERSADFLTPERRDAEQVLVQDEETARRIAEAARGGTPLEEAAQVEGASVQPLPDLARDSLLPEMAGPIFATGAGEVSDPVRTPLGWHVFRIVSVTPEVVRSLDEVRDVIAADLKRDRAADRVFEIANELDDVLAGGAAVPEAAERLGLHVTTLPAVDAEGRTPEGGTVEGLADLGVVIGRAFQLGEGEQSPLIETREGSYYVVQVDDIAPAVLRPLDQVRDEVIAAWRAEQRSAAAAARAEELAEAMRSGGDAAQVAASAGAETAVVGPIDRSGNGRGRIPEAFVGRLFAMTPGEVATAAGRDGQVIVRLTGIEVPDPAADETAVAALSDRIGRMIASDLLDQYVAALRSEYDVAVNRDVIDQMYRQD